jgi:hypothetical protein
MDESAPKPLISGEHRRNKDMVVRQVGDECLVLDLEAERIHQLNATASFIWHNFDRAPTPDAMAQLLAFEFDVAQDTAISDVQTTFRTLRELKLIVGDESEAGHCQAACS